MTVIGSPKTKAAMAKFKDGVLKRRSLEFSKAKPASKNASTACKKKRLSNCDVSEFLIKNSIRKESELMQAALKRSANGEKDLQAFILNKTPKALTELISTSWKIQEAPLTVTRERSSRISIIREHASRACDAKCQGEWLRCAKEVLLNNRINSFYFACALRNAFMKGRHKNVNVLIIGPTNCGKSFLLNPIELIFNAFVNPATGRYAWVGLDECEVAYLNDFRWSAEIIAWSDFLLLLEGQTVHLPRPKNQYATDLCIDRKNTIPFFATSKASIDYIGRYNIRDDRESDMMHSRWQTFSFTHQIPADKAKHLEPCTHCFSKLVLEGSEVDGDS
jgi:hypothetical protein